MLIENTDLRLAIEKLERKTDNNTQNLEVVFRYLDEIHDREEKQKPRKRIGFKIGVKKKK